MQRIKTLYTKKHVAKAKVKCRFQDYHMGTSTFFLDINWTDGLSVDYSFSILKKVTSLQTYLLTFVYTHYLFLLAHSFAHSYLCKLRKGLTHTQVWWLHTVSNCQLHWQTNLCPCQVCFVARTAHIMYHVEKNIGHEVTDHPLNKEYIATTACSTTLALLKVKEKTCSQTVLVY